MADRLDSMRFVDFDVFKAQSGMPRFPDNRDLCVPTSEIDRNKSLIVFISHTWVRSWSGAPGYDTKPHPDSKGAEKFKLCVEGIDLILKQYTPKIKKCYLWLDYSCLDQDDDPAAEVLFRFDKLIEYCDCLFTPIYLPDTNPDASADRAHYGNYQALDWNGKHGYLNRAWCRLEMFFGANVPLIHDPDRQYVFSSGAVHFPAKGIRPHFIYGTSESKLGKPPILRTYIPNFLISDFNPLQGILTNDKHDRPIISQLLTMLEPYLKASKSGYYGDRKDGRMDGKGLFRYPDGSTYDGEWKNNKKFGRGVYKYKNGDTYEGDWQLDKYHGQGKFTFLDGAVYEGGWKEGQRHGKGTFRFVNGDLFVGNWRDGKKHGKGVYTYVDGAVYEGEYLNDVSHGTGTYR